VVLEYFGLEYSSYALDIFECYTAMSIVYHIQRYLFIVARFQQANLKDTREPLDTAGLIARNTVSIMAPRTRAWYAPRENPATEVYK
jgi:hypothetical protein